MACMSPTRYLSSHCARIRTSAVADIGAWNNISLNMDTSLSWLIACRVGMADEDRRDALEDLPEVPRTLSAMICIWVLSEGQEATCIPVSTSYLRVGVNGRRRHHRKAAVLTTGICSAPNRMIASTRCSARPESSKGYESPDLSMDFG